MMMLVCLLVLSIVRESLQHGYMIDPPSRSSLWRVNKKAPPNYNDNRLYCGGRSVSNLYLKTSCISSNIKNFKATIIIVFEYQKNQDKDF